MHRRLPPLAALPGGIPLMRSGLANAWLIVFVESLADFGNPIVLGGSFGVLATGVFFAVAGPHQDFGRPAVLAAVMPVVALAAFMGQRAIVGKRSYASMTGKGDAGLPSPLPNRVRRAACAVHHAATGRHRRAHRGGDPPARRPGC